ncbi:MAG: Gfo/Idh/MocA family oxidoreductase [Chloroflexota bacterium]|nr:Gfo/Idh/MocA family oxidoreductase [Chloroflexota bacterium]
MIRLGVIGYGRRMRHVLATIDRFGAGTKVVALVDPRAEALRQEFPDALAGVTAYDTAAAMLDAGAVDGVLIGTRCSLHTPYAIEVLERGLPLFLEKPVAISFEQVAALGAAAERSRSQVVVSFPLRLSALCRAALEIVDSGAIGTIEQVQAVNNVPFYAGGYYHGWMRDEAETGGLWLQKATHDLDYLNAIVRQRPVRITAMESKTVFRGDMPAGLRCVDCELQQECPESPYNLFYLQGVTERVEPNDWRCSFAPDTGNHDSASAIVAYESGLHAVYTQNFYTRRGAAARGATLIGYRGTITFDWYREELVVHHHHRARTERHQFASTGTGHHGGDEELARDFLAILTGRGESRAPLASGVRSAQLCLLARESCRTNTVQEVRALDEARSSTLTATT